MTIRCIIVDDEALARSRVSKFLAQEAEVEVIQECSNGIEAIACIREHRPDLVFLDVQMPEVGGFDVLHALAPEELPQVVFITAHDQHALKAFEVHALDYLLKPFTQARLQESLRRARRRLEAREADSTNQKLVEWLKSTKGETTYWSRIVVKTGTQMLFVKVEDVDYIESASNYAVLHTKSGNHILRETITNLETRFPPHLFVRISRSTIVNLERVKGIQSGPEDEHLMILQDGRQLAVTRGLREIQERLQYPDKPPVTAK